MQGQPGPNDLWGKFRDAEHAGPAWHPLIAHSIDVACVFEALLAQPTLRRRLARAGQLDELDAVQIARLSYLVFLHDLGKCHLGFRAKAAPGLAPLCGHIAALRPVWIKGPEARALLQAIDAEALDRWFGRAAGPLLEAVFAHHGRMPDLAYDHGSHFRELAGWIEHEREPLQRLAELATAARTIFPEAFRQGGAAIPHQTAFEHLFAGLVMLADWIGSSEAWFPFADTLDGREQFVRAQAPSVLHDLGLGRPPLPSPLPDFSTQFSFSPRAAQSAMDHLDLPDARGSVVLLESETGSGKTEAALRWASRLIEARLVDGCFFAVPLRSAAVQLQQRMQRWLDATCQADTPEALLAVPGYFRMGEAEGTRLPEFRVQWTDEDNAARRMTRWAAEHPKRYAAANFAVGTIDQVLLGTLPTRHAHLRAACLVRHLLVIDEVHASDAYMMTLIGRILDLFRAAGGHVLLMSATLGADAQARLIERKPLPPPLSVSLAVPYPRIARSRGAAVAVAQEAREKLVAVTPSAIMDDPVAVARMAADAVAAGARVLVLRNTVRAAIQVQEAIEAALGPDHPALFVVNDVVTLHHGRFAAEDRRLLDAEVERRFGKQGADGPALIVATQTLEQSLDVDADLLITDLCPIDVLLQRIGRLHRHEERTGRRPPGFEQASCIVLLPTDGDLTPRLDFSLHGIGKERAYANVLAVEATRRLIGEAATWSIPTDNRRLVEAGTHPEALRALLPSLDRAWEEHWQTYHGARSQERSHARMSSIDFTKPFKEVPWPADEERVATRLGTPELLLPLARPIRSPFGLELTHLKVPHWMAPFPLPDGDLVLAVTDDATLRLDKRLYRYGRMGLVTAPVA